MEKLCQKNKHKTHKVRCELKVRETAIVVIVDGSAIGAAALLRVPRATRDVIRLRDDAVSLRSAVSSILQKLKKDAAQLTQLSSTVEDVFASGDLPGAAETPANMGHSLSAVGENEYCCVTFFSDKGIFVASQRVAAFADTVKELVYDVLLSKVRQRLGDVSRLRISSSVGEQGVFPLPTFSADPQSYVTSVGGNLDVVAVVFHGEVSWFIRYLFWRYVKGYKVWTDGALHLRVAAFADTVKELVYDVLVSKVRQRLGDMSRLPISSSVGEQGAFPLPTFSAYPESYITSVGEYLLLTLPQQFEPFADGISNMCILRKIVIGREKTVCFEILNFWATTSVKTGIVVIVDGSAIARLKRKRFSEEVVHSGGTMMLDLGPFSNENFDPKKCINSACQSRHPQDSLDKHLLDMEMKLQMASVEIAASLEDQSAAALLRVPRTTRDVIRLRDDAVSLRSAVSSIL
ncbi:hypothetical protein RJT34_31576 [Clitoria ternatea]|uniref:Conserved oligomeric Golgi complex subunit 7 n=1 Tax=Clitoria ternatea TaxID=43366 RepID=A0AAN9EV98_CLITE